MCTQLKAEDSSVDSEEYVTVFTSYISACIDNIVMLQNVSKPEATVELWGTCHAMLHARSAAFASSDADRNKKARYDLRRYIMETKTEAGRILQQQEGFPACH